MPEGGLRSTIKPKSHGAAGEEQSNHPHLLLTAFPVSDQAAFYVVDLIAPKTFI